MLKKIICLLPLFFLLISCSDDDQSNSNDAGKSALGKKSVQEIGAINLLFPEAFELTEDPLSLTDQHNYHDRQREIYFTMDELRNYQVDKFKSDFPEIDSENSEEFILNLAAHFRRSDQIANQLSHTKKGINKANKNYLTAIVEGQEYYDSEVLSYVYASTEIGEKIYLFQFICATNNLKYYYSEFIEIIESVKFNS